jgi:Protein kinase domain
MAERFGDFELLTLLSADAALESYLAQPSGGGAQVVLRRMRPSVAQQPGSRDSFLNDAQAAMRLQHASAARVVAVGEVGHQPYLAQERIDGDSLESIVLRARSVGQAWPLAPARALALFLPALEGLAAAHAQTPALLHREVSPRNVYVTPQGKAVMSGFGLARTRRTAGLGISDAFLSPEQMTGRPLDASSDVFTAALVLFELCCGRLPATGTVGEIAARIGALELDAPEAVHPGAAPVAEVLKKALARHDQRYAHAGEFLSALKALDIAPEAPEALAQWLATLPAKPLPPPALPPRPVQVETQSGRLVAVMPEAPPPAAAKTEKKPRLTGVGKAGVGIVAGLLAAQLYFWIAGTGAQSVQGRRDHPVPEHFKTEVLSQPPGASVRVNEKRYGKTPTFFDAERDALYTVKFDNGESTIEVVVQNAKVVEVNTETGEVIRDDRYVPGPRSEKKNKTQKRDEPAPDQAPKTDQGSATPVESVKPTFHATAPASFALLKQHQVRVDDAPQLPLRAGSLSEFSGGFRSPAAGGRQGGYWNQQSPTITGKTRAEQYRNFANANPGALSPETQGVVRHLSLVLTRLKAGLKLTAVNPGPVALPAQPSWAFALVERTPNVIDGSPTFSFSGQRQDSANASVVIVEADNRFNVDGLDDQAWRLTLRPRAPGSGPQVVLKLEPAAPSGAVLLDGATLETRTAVLESASSHVVTGAKALWLAVPTVSGFEAGTVDVTIGRDDGVGPPGTTPAR